jgi:hypothetical protein
MLFVGACSSAPGGGPIQLASTPEKVASSVTLSPAERDSAFAQFVAEREGPRVSVSAEFTTVAYGSRRIRANIHLDDDAYVLVGQIGPDGIVRIVFPEQPTDDGLLHGKHSYQTAEFFAGFQDQYRYRLTTSPYSRFGGATRDSYDLGFGYLFVIASWRPMRFDQFSTGGVWDSFELTDNEYLRDPRPAVYELAALLAGPNREAYTVEFAHYSNTQYAFDNGSGFGRASTYGYGYCSGYAPFFGFSSTPFDRMSLFNSLLPYGESFYYRGQYYAYDAFGDCYSTRSPYSGWGYGYGGYIVAQAPPIYPQRKFNLGARDPINPQPPRARLAVDAAKATDANSPGAKVSPVYRSRGLLTSDTPDPRRSAGSEPVTRTRPTIQDMVGDHFEGRQGVTRAQLAGDDGNTRATRNQPRFETPTRGRETNNNDSRGFTRPAPGDDARPTPRTEPPRTESPRIESPRSEPRSESPRAIMAPPPRSEAPRSEPPRVETPRSSPPPAPAPRTEAPPPRPPEVKPPGR